jgi:HEAT repeat protein
MSMRAGFAEVNRKRGRPSDLELISARRRGAAMRGPGAAISFLITGMTMAVMAFPAGASAQTTQSEYRKMPKQEPMVIFKDGRLTVNAENDSLRQILDEISERARVAIAGPKGAEATLVSVNFEHLPLDVGLRQLLKDYDAFFYYGKERPEGATLRAVWIFPAGAAKGLAPIPSDQWASTRELEDMLTDPDPAVRSEAYKGLIERQGSGATRLVLQALKDFDSQVQWEALYDARGAGIELPEETLEDLVINGTTPEIKVLALEDLRGNPDLGSIAEQALDDPDAHVEAKAREILGELRDARSSRPGEPAASPRTAVR